MKRNHSRSGEVVPLFTPQQEYWNGLSARLLTVSAVVISFSGLEVLDGTTAHHKRLVDFAREQGDTVVQESISTDPNEIFQDHLASLLENGGLGGLTPVTANEYMQRIFPLDERVATTYKIVPIDPELWQGLSDEAMNRRVNMHALADVVAQDTFPEGAESLPTNGGIQNRHAGLGLRLVKD